MKQSKIIGLTGGIASGKSTVSKYLAKKGLPIVDADLIARQVVEPNSSGLSQLVEAFGKNILNGDALDRRALRNIAFKDPAALKLLNSILHPLIHDEIKRQLSLLDGKEEVIIFDVPLLFENKLENMVDKIWVVAVERATQVARLIARDECTEDDALAIISKQMPLEEKIKHADVVIWNEKSLMELYEMIDQLIENQG